MVCWLFDQATGSLCYWLLNQLNNHILPSQYITKIQTTNPNRKPQMNKQKLIGLIIKKQTYKDTKVIQNDIQRKKEQAVNVSIAAIHQILKDDYNAQAKLYAYLKDCFEKGNQMFIEKTQEKILGVLVKFVKDSENQAAIMSYGGSYTKSVDLEKFKSLITSLFTMSYQCIEKWAVWIPDRNRGFVKAQKEVAKVKKVARKQQFTYFRAENEEIFRQNCLKNGIKLAEPSGAPLLQKQNISQKPKPIQPQLKAQSQPQPQPKQQPQPQPPKQNPQSVLNPKQKYRSMVKITSILKQTEQKLMKSQFFTPQQLTQTQAKFNAAVNEYIEEASQFDEHFLQNKIEQFEGMKQAHNNKKADKASKVQNKKQQKEQEQQESQKSVSILPPKSVQSPTFQNINTNIEKSGGNSNSNLPQKSVIKPEKVQYVPKNEQLPKIVVIPAKTQVQPPPKKQNIMQQPSLNKKIKMPAEDDQRVRFQVSSEGEQDEESDNYEGGYGKKSLLPKTKTEVNKNLSNDMKMREKPPASKPTAKLVPEDEFLPPKVQVSSNATPKQSIKSSVIKQNQKKPLQIIQPKPATNTNYNNLSNNFSKKQQKVQTFASIMKPQPPSQHQPLSSQPSQIQPSGSQLSQSSINHQAQLDRLTKKYQYQTVQLYQKLQRLQKQMLQLKQNQSKTSQLSKITPNPNTKQLEQLRYKLRQQQQDKSNMNQQINQLKMELMKMKREFDKSRDQWKSLGQSQDVSQNVQNFDNASHRPSNTSKLSNYKVKKVITVSNVTNNNNNNNIISSTQNLHNNPKQQPILPVLQSPVNINPYSPRIDEDYINNMTSFQKIGSWLDQKNVLSFKLCVLGLGQQFYNDENMKIYKMQHFFTENGALFLKITFSYHFKRMQDKMPKIVYKNIAEIDFWTKPIYKSNEIYSQETIARLCLVPIKIMKGTIHFGDNLNKNITFLLPFLYYNYLQPSQFDPQQLQSILKSKTHQTIKSKVIHLSNSISNSSISMPNILKGSVLNNQYLSLCLREESDDRVFLTQIQLLRNQKAVIRVLPIPSDPEMGIKGKELVDNLVFLLGA